MQLFAKVEAKSFIGCRCGAFIINVEQVQQIVSSVFIFKVLF